MPVRHKPKAKCRYFAAPFTSFLVKYLLLSRLNPPSPFPRLQTFHLIFDQEANEVTYYPWTLVHCFVFMFQYLCFSLSAWQEPAAEGRQRPHVSSCNLQVSSSFYFGQSEATHEDCAPVFNPETFRCLCSAAARTNNVEVNSPATSLGTPVQNPAALPWILRGVYFCFCWHVQVIIRLHVYHWSHSGWWCIILKGGSKILHLSKIWNLNIKQCRSTLRTTASITNITSLNGINFVEAEFMAELLCWITLDCTSEPNEVY